MKLADITYNLEGQKMFQILAQARALEKQGKNVIHFEIGDPDFNSPEIAKNTLKNSLDNNLTHYVPSSGLSELKHASIEATFKSRGFKPKENQLLKMLVLNFDDLLPRDIALNKIWRDANYFTSRSMDVYIAKLRKYLDKDKSLKIINVHGEGFRLMQE